MQPANMLPKGNMNAGIVSRQLEWEDAGELLMTQICTDEYTDKMIRPSRTHIRVE
jgi:hypothetical protein